MAWKERRPIWFHFYAGRDIMGFMPFCVRMVLVGRPDLMRKGDEGRPILAGLAVELYFRPYYTFWTAGGRVTLNLPRLWIRSDVGEIARRLAA